jgi:hypothetical protein
MLLLMDQCTARNNEVITLKYVCLLYLLPNTISYMQLLDQGLVLQETSMLKAYSTFSAVRNRQSCSHGRHKKMEHRGCCSM